MSHVALSGLIAGMESIAERTKRLRENKRLSQSELARKLDVKPQAIQALEAGKVKRPRFIVPLAKALGVSATYMETGVDVREVRGLRVEGTAEAGNFREIDLVDDLYDDMPIIQVAANPRFPHARQYALLISGDSMNRRFPNGAYVTCVNWADAGLDLKPGMCLHVERVRGPLVEVTVKCYAERKGRRWLDPDSTDPKFQPIEINGDEETEIIIKGLVTGSWRPEFF